MKADGEADFANTNNTITSFVSAQKMLPRLSTTMVTRGTPACVGEIRAEGRGGVTRGLLIGQQWASWAASNRPHLSANFTSLCLTGDSSFTFFINLMHNSTALFCTF